MITSAGVTAAGAATGLRGELARIARDSADDSTAAVLALEATSLHVRGMVEARAAAPAPRMTPAAHATPAPLPPGALAAEIVRAMPPPPPGATAPPPPGGTAPPPPGGTAPPPGDSGDPLRASFLARFRASRDFRMRQASLAGLPDDLPAHLLEEIAEAAWEQPEVRCAAAREHERGGATD